MSKVLVGQIVAPHGLNGKVKVISDTNLKTKVFTMGNFLYLKDNTKLEIINYQANQKFLFLTFKDYDSIEDISNLLNQDLFVEIEEIALEPTEFLEGELIKAQVLENKQILGEVKEILKGKKYDYVKVKGAKEFLIPLIKEFIIEFKRQEKVLVVKKATDLII